VFQGASQINLDAKGRLAVPTRVRDPLTQGGTVSVVLTAHPDKCLLLYPAPGVEPVRAKVMSFPSLDAAFNREAPARRLRRGDRARWRGAAADLSRTPGIRGHRQARDVRRAGELLRDLGLERWQQQLDRLTAAGSPVLPPGMENFSL